MRSSSVFSQQEWSAMLFFLGRGKDFWTTLVYVRLIPQHEYEATQGQFLVELNRSEYVEDILHWLSYQC